MMKKRRRARNGVRASSHPPPVKIGRFEPVEITQVNASKGNSYKDEDDEDDEDEDGFNDAEEITDDLLETAQTPSSVNDENTKIELDINIGILQQYM